MGEVDSDPPAEASGTRPIMSMPPMRRPGMLVPGIGNQALVVVDR
jgi:hypothetical protein